MSVAPKLSIMVAMLAMPSTAITASGGYRSASVDIADLDISTDAGRTILAQRVERAARNICDFASDQIDLKVRRIENQCREEASAAALAKVKRQSRVTKR